MRTKDVELGNGLTVTIRTPRFAVWSEYERLMFGGEEDTRTREEKRVAAYEAREKGREEDAVASPPPAPPVTTLTGERARRVLDYVERELIPDVVLAFKDGDEVRPMLDAGGQPIIPPPVDVRDIGPHRVMLIAQAATEMIRESLGYSFRTTVAAGNGTPRSRPRARQRADTARHSQPAGG